MIINNELKNYIEKFILSRYSRNDKGHGIDHIRYVINRSIKFASELENINMDMVYTIAAYHDIGHNIDSKNHEIVSAQILLEDEYLQRFFTRKEIIIMSEAIEDHRASSLNKPRSIYGNIVSTADRNTDIETPIKRTYEYRIAHSPNSSLKQIIDESYVHLVSKFGHEGYALEKIYFEDLEYMKFLEEMGNLLNNRDEFDKRYIEINGLNNNQIK